MQISQLCLIFRLCHVMALSLLSQYFPPVLIRLQNYAAEDTHQPPRAAKYMMRYHGLQAQPHTWLCELQGSLSSGELSEEDVAMLSRGSATNSASGKLPLLSHIFINILIHNSVVPVSSQALASMFWLGVCAG